MQYRILGKTNFKVSEIGFGAWAIGEEAWGKQDLQDSLRALHQAAELGANFIDTAAIYGNGNSEKVIAKFRKEWKGDLIVATKTPPEAGNWPPGPHDSMEGAYSEKYLRKNIEDRLRYLEVDCLDLIQLHTWTRAWNKNPTPFEILRKLQKEGKVKAIGVSTPEHDQDSVTDLIKQGMVDTVQVIYNIFEQDPASELLPTALEYNVGVIIRVAFDEGSLTGKFTKDTVFAKGDFRSDYFRGERLGRTVERVALIQKDLEGSDFTMPQAALKFSLSNKAVSTVIVGIRNEKQAAANLAVSDLPAMPEMLLNKLYMHLWRRAIWHGGDW